MKQEILFHKVCKCGNTLHVTGEVSQDLRQTHITTEVNYEPTCYMIGTSTLQCVGCAKRHRMINRDAWHRLNIL